MLAALGNQVFRFSSPAVRKLTNFVPSSPAHQPKVVDTTRLKTIGRRELRKELSVRQALVEVRAQYVVTIRGLARAEGTLLPSCSSCNFLDRLEATTLDDKTRLLIAQYFEGVSLAATISKRSSGPSSGVELSAGSRRRSRSKRRPLRSRRAHRPPASR